MQKYQGLGRTGNEQTIKLYEATNMAADTYISGSGLLPMSCTTVIEEYSMRNLLRSVAMLQDMPQQISITTQSLYDFVTYIKHYYLITYLKQCTN